METRQFLLLDVFNISTNILSRVPNLTPLPSSYTLHSPARKRLTSEDPPTTSDSIIRLLLQPNPLHLPMSARKNAFTPC